MYLSKKKLQHLARKEDIRLSHKGKVLNKSKLVDKLEEIYDFNMKKSELYEKSKLEVKDISREVKLIPKFTDKSCNRAMKTAGITSILKYLPCSLQRPIEVITAKAGSDGAIYLDCLREMKKVRMI